MSASLFARAFIFSNRRQARARAPCHYRLCRRPERVTLTLRAALRCRPFHRAVVAMPQTPLIAPFYDRSACPQRNAVCYDVDARRAASARRVRQRHVA